MNDFELINENGSSELILRGKINTDVEKALCNLKWDKLTLIDVDWTDYSLLCSFSEKIKELSIIQGPRKLKGLNHLINLEKFKMDMPVTKSLSFRNFKKLKELKIMLADNYPMEQLNNEV